MLLNSNALTIKFLRNSGNNLLILINQNLLYYTAVHIKLSSLAHSVQLLDIFAYELPYNSGLKKKNNLTLPANTVIYNFYAINENQRFFIFIKNQKNKQIFSNTPLKSVTELFPNANWLEREVSEMNNIFFLGKRDIRNLLLQYGDTSAPLKKSFPCVGLREIFYESLSDTLTQTPISLQF